MKVIPVCPFGKQVMTNDSKYDEKPENNFKG
ncbi:hypothetical protein BHX94_06625 [Macrococcoides bohemicum]|uniref:Uncharacterized protein n=1 Tax=Macrococcoides bohemicum TaxID=1903056 RepID=A0A328A4S0_9STAP|nr:hypothetical protein BHX94_06625 [Macrococcus bohemicus]